MADRVRSPPRPVNGHLQTIIGNFLPRGAFDLPFDTDIVEVDRADGSRVLCHAHWHSGSDMHRRLTLLLVHGLEGSSDSRYIQGLTARAWAAGCNVVRMNMRNCNNSDALTPTLYHSALSGDVGAVVEHYTKPVGTGARRAGRLLHGRQPGAETRRRMGSSARPFAL